MWDNNALSYNDYVSAFPVSFDGYGRDPEGYIVPPARDYPGFRAVLQRCPVALRSKLTIQKIIGGSEWAVRVERNPLAEKWINVALGGWFQQIVNGAVNAIFEGFAVAAWGIKTSAGGEAYYDDYGRQPLDYVNFPFPEQVMVRCDKRGEPKNFKQHYPDKIVARPDRSVIWTFGERRGDSPYGAGVIEAAYHLARYWSDLLAHLLKLVENAHKPNLTLQLPNSMAKDRVGRQKLLDWAVENYMKPDGKVFAAVKGRDNARGDVDVIPLTAGALAQVIKVLEYVDRQIIIALLGVVKQFYDSSNTGGTYNLAQLQADEADRVRKGLLEGLIPPIVGKLIKPLLTHNFGADRFGRITLDFAYPDEVDRRANRSLLEQLVQKGDPETLSLLDRLEIIMRSGFATRDGGVGQEQLARRVYRSDGARVVTFDRQGEPVAGASRHDHAARPADVRHRLANPVIREALENGRKTQTQLEDYYDKHLDRIIAAIQRLEGGDHDGQGAVDVAASEAGRAVADYAARELNKGLAYVGSVYEDAHGDAPALAAGLEDDYEATLARALDRYFASVASVYHSAAAADRRGVGADPDGVKRAGLENAATRLANSMMDQLSGHHLDLVIAAAKAKQGGE